MFSHTFSKTEKTFSNRLDFGKEIADLYKNNIVFCFIESGICHMKPEILPVGDCCVSLYCLNIATGGYDHYRFEYKEVRYEGLRFD